MDYETISGLQPCTVVEGGCRLDILKAALTCKLLVVVYK